MLIQRSQDLIHHHPLDLRDTLHHLQGQKGTLHHLQGQKDTHNHLQGQKDTHNHLWDRRDTHSQPLGHNHLDTLLQQVIYVVLVLFIYLIQCEN